MALVDVLAGLHAAVAVVAALNGGEGGRIEVPLLDAGLAGLVNVAQNAIVTGREPERHGNAHPNIVPYQDFETASGRIAVAAANDGLFRAMCRVLGLEELAGDARFATNPARVENRRELIPLLQERLRERGADEWVEALDGAGVPVGKVRTRARRARGRRRGGPPGDAERRAPHRGSARSRGLADLGSDRQLAGRRPRRSWASTPPRCWANWAAPARR